MSNLKVGDVVKVVGVDDTDPCFGKTGVVFETMNTYAKVEFGETLELLATRYLERAETVTIDNTPMDLPTAVGYLQTQLDESRAEGQRLQAEVEELKNGVGSVITERNIARNALERIHRNLGHLAFDIARDALKLMDECWQSEEAIDTTK